MARRRSTLDEATLIGRYFAGPQALRADVVLGIGDDAAVTRLRRGCDLVTATDALFEGVHYPRGTPPRAIGHRCLAVNLSDLAAMGAKPLWASLALSLPRATGAWLREFSAGFFALAEAWNVALIGGDTVRGPPGATVTVQGEVRRGRHVTRDAARAGDGIWVTGHPGDAVAGRLLLARRGGSPLLRRRFLYPAPRLREGVALAGIASAMMDVSDGLHDDLGKLMRASGCGAELDASRLPLSRQLLAATGPAAARDMALCGGDDYELLFTVPARREAQLARLTRDWAVPATRIGTVRRAAGLRWSLDGKPFRFRDRTFRHFR